MKEFFGLQRFPLLLELMSEQRNYSCYDFYVEVIFDNLRRFNFLLSRENSALIEIGNKIKTACTLKKALN